MQTSAKKIVERRVAGDSIWLGVTENKQEFGLRHRTFRYNVLDSEIEVGQAMYDELIAYAAEKSGDLTMILLVKSGWLQYVLNGPEMHRWHHGLGNPKLNYSTKLAIWDWIFGTGYNPDKKPRGYGFTAKSHYPEEPDFAPGTAWYKKWARLVLVYFDQHAAMFRPLERPVHEKQLAAKTEAPSGPGPGPTLPGRPLNTP